MSRLQVFLGTKAQYIKTAPLLRLLDDHGITYRLIDSGQHGELSTLLRTSLGVREPDLRLGAQTDVNSITEAIGWSMRLVARLPSKRRLRSEIFDADAELCVVHGDTPSTLLSTLMARRAGLRVAHLEAGLRSRSLMHPFPEELIRLAVMRLSDLLFAPGDSAAANLDAMQVNGRVIPLMANTTVDALEYAGFGAREPASGPVIVTMHRVENLHRRSARDGLVSLAHRLAHDHDVIFMTHGPTRQVLTKSGAARVLKSAGVKLRPLVSHAEFVPLLEEAPFVVTDGGSIQEECAVIGVPTLLWRKRTERTDGLGRNVVLSAYDPREVERFLANPEAFRREPIIGQVPSPSKQILAELLQDLGEPV